MYHHVRLALSIAALASGGPVGCLASSAAAGSSAGPPAAAQAATASLATIPTPRGISQSFILIKPRRPLVSVVLFAGDLGALGLKSVSSMKWGADNFLVRTRDKFAGQNFMVAVIDTPSDRPQGMNAIFRMSDAHAEDIGAVTAYMKAQMSVPVWLIGHSMGTFSAAKGAIAAQDVDGLVLTSTVTHSMPQWAIAQTEPDGVASMPLARVAVPTLIVSHRKDTCPDSSPADTSKLRMRLTSANKVEIALLDGGAPPRSEPCESKAPHGYFGIEGYAVDTIAKFIRDNSK